MSRIKNKEESDEIKENDIKYIYNHIIVFFTYQFIRTFQKMEL